MLNLNSLMVGTDNPKRLAEFYEKVLGKPSDMADGEWYSWEVGDTFFGMGRHSEVSGSAKEPARIILNFQTSEVKEEFERIKGLGATVIKEPYEMSAEGEISPESGGEGMWIATFADPDGNYFQLMSPWKGK